VSKKQKRCLGYGAFEIFLLENLFYFLCQLEIFLKESPRYNTSNIKRFRLENRYLLFDMRFYMWHSWFWI